MCMARRQTSTQGLFFERVCTHPRLAWRSSPPPRLEGVALGPRRRALRALADDLPAGAQAVRRGVASLLPERHRRRSCDHLRWPPAATRIVACLLGGGARARAREAPGPAGRAPLRAQGGGGEDPRAWVRLLCAYRQGRFRAVAGKKIWRQVAAAASLPPTARLAPNQSVPRSRSSSELSTDHVGAEDRALFRAAKHALSRVY